MEPSSLDMILTIVVLSFWFLFPIGMFLAVSRIAQLRQNERGRRKHALPRRRAGRVSHGKIAHSM